MNTKLLELTVYLNKLQHNIVNTNMDVNIEWDIDVEKKTDCITLKYSFEKIAGTFTVTHARKEFYTKEVYYKFTIAEFSSWKISHVPFQTDEISPTGAIINFDEKTINIKF